MNPIKRYVINLSEHTGRAWNRWWFTPGDAFPLSVLRIFAGLLGFYYVFSHTADLVRWFGPHGLLPIDTVKRLTGASTFSMVGGQQTVYRFSYLNLFEDPTSLWIVHLLGMAVLLMFTAGLLTRVSSILSLIVVLSYVHRAPMIAAQFEPVLTMMIFYLCLAPAGAYLSLDRRFEQGWRRIFRSTFGEDSVRLAGRLLLGFAPRDPSPAAGTPGEEPKTVTANISLRLLQVHLAALYLMMGLSKLGGLSIPNEPYAATWWRGEAVWWLVTRTESRLVDLTFLHQFLINGWTHAIVLVELSFAVLIWVRVSRPLLLAISAMLWGSLALVTGLVPFCAAMLVANLAFVSPHALRQASSALLGNSRSTAGKPSVSEQAKNVAAM